MNSLGRTLLFCNLFIISICATASAQYRFDTFNTDTGLPQNSVSSILQTRDGFLWLTTNDGLVRYDGVHFRVFNAGNRKDLRSSRFSQLFEDREGCLWIITEDWRLIKYQDGIFTTYTTENGLPDDRVLRIKDEDGLLIVDTTAGLACWKNDSFVPYDPARTYAYSGFGHPVRSGAVWHFDQTGFHRVEHGRVTTDAKVSGLADSDIKTLHEDHRGELWIGVYRNTLMRFKDGRFISYSQRDGLPEGRINCMLDDRQGNLWLGLANSGLVRFKENKFTRYTTADGLAGDSILCIYEDREGIIWVGTTTGLNRLRDNIITSYSAEDGLSADNTYPICQDREGDVWIGGWRGLTKYSNGTFTRCGERFGLADALVTALMIDRKGSLWVGTYGGGVRRIKDGRVVASYETRNGLPSNIVRAIYEDRSGAIWFGTSEGLAGLKDGTLSVHTTKDGLPANAVNVIFEDHNSNLWIGTQAGLCRYRDGVFETYSHESLSNRIVRAIYEDSEGTVWIGTYDHGLTRIKDGKFTCYTVKEGLFNNGVFQILEDARGNFWMSCNLGIYRVSRKELTDYAEGRIKSITSIPYGKRDGMISSECNGGAQPAGVRTLDGKLWFPTQAGVAVVDPEAVPVSAQPPPVMIEEFLINNEPVGFSNLVKVSPGTENFEIHYTGLSFIMSERIGFKYKLEGLDTDWVDAGTRRIAYYSHVPPGSYTFRVIAANRDGIWNMEGASVPIRIIPPFWRTWWFVALTLIALVGVVLASFRLRIARLEKARRAQEAFSEQLISSQENERKRIAAELHDSLGQHLLIIKNSALLGINALNGHERGKEQLRDISETASQAIDEVREISYNLRPYQLDNIGLTKAIEYIVAKVAASSAIKFTAELDRIDDLFSPEAEINIYRILQESLNNVVKHSRATRAKIVITRSAAHITITIQDDGCGLDPDKTSGGFGLKGISERARMLGAKYAIHSAAEQGTTITLNLEIRDGGGAKRDTHTDRRRSSHLSQRTATGDRS